jgi:hypothetical protein
MTSPFDHAETERLLRGYEDALRASAKASKRAIEAQEAADQAAHEVGRYSKALSDHWKTLEAQARINVRDDG